MLQNNQHSELPLKVSPGDCLIVLNVLLSPSEVVPLDGLSRSLRLLHELFITCTLMPPHLQLHSSHASNPLSIKNINKSQIHNRNGLDRTKEGISLRKKTKNRRMMSLKQRVQINELFRRKNIHWN